MSFNVNLSAMIPGWIDLQVNGYKGVNFSDSNLSIEDIEFVSMELFKQGTLGYCPTIITSPLEIYKRNLPLISQASQSKKGAQILGIHLEGPFINPEFGPRGIHPEKYIVPPSIELYECFRIWADNSISILTLDPERKGSLSLIKHIIKTSKTVVSIGHHMAGKEIIQKSVDAGVRAATHVGNGLADTIHRHNNPIWPILAEDRLTGFFITDGFHIPKEMIKVCLRAKGISKFIVTSDLVHFAGIKPGNYVINNIPVILEPNGFLHREGTSLPAGSVSTMMECMNFLASIAELNEKDLLKIGYENPLNLLGKKINQARSSKANNLVYDGKHFAVRN